MACAVGSVSLLAPGNRSNSSFTAPSGISDGDILVILMTTGRDPALNPTAPSGFTAFTGFPATMSSYVPATYIVRIHAWYKVASGESGNYATSHVAADTEGIMYRITGGDTGTPQDVSPAFTDHPSGTGGSTVTAPTVTPTVDGSLVIWFGATWDGFGSQSPSGGTTPTFTEYSNNASGISYSQAGPLTTAGATGTKSVTASQASDRVWWAWHFVIRASAGGGGGTAHRKVGSIPIGTKVGGLLVSRSRLLLPAWCSKTNRELLAA